MHTLMDLCFLCTKDYHCVPVDSRIVSQVEYILPEITIFKLGIPLRICSVCDGALYAFTKFKQFYVESTLRLEASIKGTQGPPLHTDTPYPGPAIQLHRNTTMPQNQLQTSGVHTDTNSNNAEDISIEKKELKQTTQDQDFCKSVPENTLETHCSQPDYNIDGASSTLYASDTYGVKPEMIEEIFIKEEQEDPQEIETYDVFHSSMEDDATNNQTEDSTEEVNATPESVEMWEGTSGEPEIELLIQPNQTDPEQPSYSKHVRIKPKRNFPCTICSNSFTYKFDLTRHMKTHTAINCVHCEICRKSFSEKYLLSKHMKIHSQRTYHCDVCPKSFTYKFDLTRHMKTHSGIKDFQCEMCGKSFTKKLYLEAHMRYHADIE